MTVTGDLSISGTTTLSGAVTITGPLNITDTNTIHFTSTDNTAGAISLTTNGGTSETMLLTVDQGTSDTSLALTSVAGGVALTATASSSKIFPTKTGTVIFTRLSKGEGSTIEALLLNNN